MASPVFSAIRSRLRSLGRLSRADPARSDIRSSGSASDGPVIHIHEDDWGMRNLYPLAARAAVGADLDAAADSAERNRLPSGVGWEAVHIIEPPATSYVEAGLSIADAARVLEPIMPRVKHFYATVLSAIGRAERDPSGSYEDDAWCFGFGPHCYLKLDVEGEHVKRIWFDLTSDAPEHVSALRRSMEAIDRLAPSFIADYVMEAEVPVRDVGLLDHYFARHTAKT
jgi:hypothetical protein